ncbi:MAG TPA: hypothetical protein VEC93_13165, partial [Anaerolineae bacterium]|nr:hypothetical protein [Anaerolineae bacterium]
KPHASVDNRSEETPPPGYLEPVGNFGLIWRGEVEYLEDVRDRLGWATDPEISFETVYQCGIGDTCNGFSLYMQDPDGKILNLFYVWHFGTYWEEEFNWETYSSEDYGYSIKYPDFLIHSTDTYQRTGGPVTVDKWLPADQNYVISIFSYEDGVNPALEFNGTITDEETIQVAGFEVRKLVGTEAVAQTGALVHIGPVNYREKNQAFVYSSGSKMPPPRSLEIFYQMLETFNFTN